MNPVGSRLLPPTFPLLANAGFAYVATIAVLAVDVAWIVAAGWQVNWRGLLFMATLAALVAAPLLLARYRQHDGLRATLSASALLLIFTMAGATLSYLVISIDFPLVDAVLDRADRAIGFDWVAANAAVAHRPWLAATLSVAYASGTVQIAAVVVLLGLIGRPDRVAEFTRLFVVACIATIVLSAPFPAAGAHKFYGVAGPMFDLSILSHFEPLRDGRLRTMPLGSMQGLISIPSMHAATAFLLIWSVRRTWLLVPFAVVNALMMVATPIFGSHYLVDVIAGVGLAGTLVCLDRRHARRSLMRQPARSTARSAGRLAAASS